MDIIFVLKPSYQNLIVNHLKYLSYVNCDGSVSVKTKEQICASSLLNEIAPHSDVKIVTSGYRRGESECIISKDHIDFVLMHDEKKETI